MKSVDDIPEEELGIERDRCVDAHIDCLDAKSKLESVYVYLDAVADNPSVPTVTRNAVRQIQQQVTEEINHLETEADRVKSRLEAIESRIKDE